jgi:hypothetical protein
VINGAGRDAPPAAGEEQCGRILRPGDVRAVLAPGGDERPGAGGQGNLAELAALAEHADFACAGGNGDVGVVERGELGLAEPGIEGERYQGGVTDARRSAARSSRRCGCSFSAQGCGAAAAGGDLADCRTAQAEPRVEGADRG